MLLIVYLFLAGILGVTKGQIYSNTEFNNTLGLYFEKVNAIQQETGIWRATVYLDVEKSTNFLSTFDNKLNELIRQCLTVVPLNCHENFGFTRISNKINAAKRKEQFLIDIVQNIKEYSAHHQKGTLPSTVIKRKRSMPWFGLIGKIARPIAGILNQEDGERYEAAIKDLSAVQSNMSRLMGEQAHIIKSELHKIHEQSEKRENEISQMQQQLDEFLNNEKKIEQNIRLIRFEKLISRTALQFEFCIEEFQKGIEELLTLIQAAQEGILHHSLITKNQILTMAKEIQEAMPGMDFPVPASQINIIHLSQIAKVSMRMQGTQILVAIDIPLLGRDTYDLYKMHQIPIVQTGQPKADRAYILPRTKYLALERDYKKYFYLNNDFLQGCKMYNYKYICQLQQPVYDANALPSCEVNLLRNPTLEILRTCDVRLSTNQKPYWAPILSLGGWLYSVTKKEIARIRCNGKEKHLELKGNGIIQIATDCVLNTDSVTLTALPIFDDPTEYVYEPHLNLNISELSPELTEYRLTTTDIKKSTNKSNLSPIWDSEKTDVALTDLERQWNALSEHRVKLQQYQLLTHSTIGGITLLAAVFFICFFRKPLCKFANCIIPSCKIKKEETILQPSIHYEVDISKLTNQSNFMKTSKSEGESPKLTKIPINLATKGGAVSKHTKPMFPVC